MGFFTKKPPPKKKSSASGFILIVIVLFLLVKSGAIGHSVSSYSGFSYSGGSGPANERLANRMAAQIYGWTGDETVCLDELWTEESGWNEFSENSQSGAYGIPQSLPADKMASAGSDWRTNPVTQIRWGLGYIHDRYGTPCSAWAFEKSHVPNWY